MVVVFNLCTNATMYSLEAYEDNMHANAIHNKRAHISHKIRRYAFLDATFFNISAFFCWEGDRIDFQVHRVPFFLEPGYLTKPDNWTEPHNVRMVRKFGSMEAFDRVKKAHGLIPRGAEVGLNKSCGLKLHSTKSLLSSDVCQITYHMSRFSQLPQASINRSWTSASKAQPCDHTD